MRTILLMIIVALFSLNISAQEIPEEENKSQNTETPEVHYPTGKELIATRKILKSFNENINQTFDLKSALKGISVDDWAARTTAELFTEEINILPGITKSELIKSNTAEKFYVAFGNFIYIGTLHHLMLADGHEKNECIPNEAKVILETNPFFKSFYGEASSEIENPNSLSQYANYVQSFKEGTSELERVLRRKIFENPELFSENLSKIDHEMRSKFPEVEVLSEARFGLPIGTRLITAQAGIGYLMIANTKHGFKVVSVMLNFGD